MKEITYRGHRIRTGEKYQPGQDAKQIAQFIRRNIARAKRDGTIPKALHTTVLVRRYANGCSIDIVVRGLPQDAPPFDSNVEAQYSDYGMGINELLSPIYESYQRTEDNSPGDYRSSNFLGFVKWQVVPA